MRDATRRIVLQVIADALNARDIELLECCHTVLARGAELMTAQSHEVVDMHDLVECSREKYVRLLAAALLREDSDGEGVVTTTIKLRPAWGVPNVAG